MFEAYEKRAYIIAEMSGNHNGEYQNAVDIMVAAKKAGADAIKIQTYTADTLTLDCDNDYFRIKGGTLWDGKTMYELYKKASTPWEWQSKLKDLAVQLEIDFFSSPFDSTAVDFLEELDVPFYKVASPELIDVPLLEKIASTGKPVIMSTGMGTISEIEEAIQILKNNGCPEIALLKCTSAYPATPDNMNLMTIPNMKERYGCSVGLSDHSLELAVPITAVALGATIVEKHFCLSRAVEGVDSKFSLEPKEFQDMVQAIRVTEKAKGSVMYEPTKSESAIKVGRKSLWIAEDVDKGSLFTEENVRSVRPGHGLHPRHLNEILGKRSAGSCKKGTPFSWDCIE
ncbi:MAG: pseudaminic acid synthase [Fibrobacterales bacterium]